jgi:integrase
MKKEKTRQATRKQNLLRHKSGRYYARTFANGKEVWKSLGTSHFGVAEAKLAEFLKEHLRRRDFNGGEPAGNAKMTFSEALAIHRQEFKDRLNIKPATVRYWNQIFLALDRSWPGLLEREVRRISPNECREWASVFAKKSSPTRFNNTIDALRHVFKVAIDAGILYRNPAAELKRARIRPRQLRLPTRAEFCQLIEVIADGRGRFSRPCAEFVQGLAFTGMRKGESAQLAWRDLDFNRDQILIRGDPETGTKNWEIRRIPMIPEARALFYRMRSVRGHEKPTGKVFRVRESQKAIDRACKKLRIERITHHDLRHLFATTCIESGVDIPTVSRFLGHKDGGNLAMRTYGHLRNEHAALQAKKVSFRVLEMES